MTTMKITGMTVSLELKRSTYGQESAEDKFVALKADVPTPSEGLTLEEALEQSLTMHLTAWKSIYSSELAAKKISQDDFNARMASMTTRTNKILTYLKENPNE